jgi:hypothetical protein
MQKILEVLFILVLVFDSQSIFAQGLEMKGSLQNKLEYTTKNFEAKLGSLQKELKILFNLG